VPAFDVDSIAREKRSRCAFAAREVASGLTIRVAI
jgi:hypothetical protein